MHNQRQPQEPEERADWRNSHGSAEALLLLRRHPIQLEPRRRSV
jgi:hypothetical protein